MLLENLHPKASELVNKISVGLLRKVQDAFENLSQMETRCSDSLSWKRTFLRFKKNY